VAKLDPKKAIEIFGKYLNEIENLQGVPCESGKESRDELDEKIRSLINISFDDSREKLEHYKTNPSFSLSTGMSDEEKKNAHQSYHEQKLSLMKQYVIAYREELKLLIDTSEKTGKLDELEEKIKEKNKEINLEAERRKGVAEQKFYGAVIELLDMQRNELKRRGESDKEISELKIRLSHIEEKISKGTVNKTLSSEFEEDRLYDELVEATQGNNQKETLDLVVSARKILAEIKGLRNEVLTLQKQYELSQNVFEKGRLETKVTQKVERMTNLLRELAKIWGDSVRRT